MSGIGRAIVSAGIFTSAAFAGIFWLYLEPTVRPLMQEFAGPFSDQWDLLQWVFPTTVLVMMFVAGLYLVFGGVQEEKNVEVRRRR